MRSIKLIILGLTAFVFTPSCNHEHTHEHIHDKASELLNEHETEKEVVSPTFVHTVFFWMKEDLSDEEAKFFESELEKLGQCPTINSYKYGKPAGTPREVVDNSYGYAWIVDFATSEDQDAYQEEPIHLEFIDNCKDLWTRVQVYDTILD